jgi:hypothetical protein
MRTKTAILAAALTALGSAAVMAQTNVYSLNAVGYVNVTLFPGFNMIADQLQSGTNTIGNLINDASGYYDHMVVYKWTGTGFQSDTANSAVSSFADNWIANGVITLNPGEAAWLKNPNSTNVTITFVGTVPQGTLNTTIAGPNAFSMISSQVPQGGDLATDLGFTNFNQGDTMYVFNPTNQAYKVYNYNTNTGNSGFGSNFTGGTGDPILAVGQGFWYKTGASAPATTTWSRTFSVNQ